MATDFVTLKLTAKPNQFLVAPPGLCTQATPHQAAPAFQIAPEALLAAFDRVVQRQPRIETKFKEAAKAEYVQRSALFRFPDVISVEARPAGGGGSTLAIYSRSVYGHSDLGVNRARISAWLAALGTELA